MIKILRIFLSLCLIAIILFTNISQAFALSGEQKKVLDSGVFYFNVASACATADDIGAVNKKAYLLGDSLLAGSFYTNTYLEDNLLANNWQAYADASVGRSITTGGSDPTNTRPGHEQSGLDAIATDADTIQNEDTTAIVIELGTNTSGPASQFEDQIKQVVGKVKDLNKTATIYWVNIVSEGSSLYDQYNKKLNDLSKDVGYKVIDAKSHNIALGPDKLHPTTNGYKDYAKVISGALGKINKTANSTPATGGGTCCSVDGASSLTGSTNEEKTWNYFKSKGLSNEQTAGIMGNMLQESHFDPQIIQGGGRSKTPSDAGGGGWGIIQWTPGSKIVGMAKTAGVNGPIYELQTQLDLVWQHMHNHPVVTKTFDLNYFKKITSEVDAAIYFGSQIEGFGVEGARNQFATDILKKYGAAQNGANQVITDVSGGDCSQISGPGSDTKYVDGFTVYNQCDPEWANKAYSSSTICASGCGPSAMAMIITNLTGEQVTPDETSKYAASRGMYIPGSGSSWSISTVLAQHWGLKSKAIGADAAKIAATLQAGGLVITSGQGPEPFTSGGHFIVIRAVTADGKWKVGDSAHKDANTKEWDPQQLLASMNDGSVYAISK